MKTCSAFAISKELHLSKRQNNNNHSMVLVQDYLSEPVPEETFTHTYPDHQRSFISILHLLRSI